MMTQFWLFALAFLPGFCFGADLVIEDSQDWQPMNQTQLEAVTQKVVRAGGQVVDGSVFKANGGFVTILSVPMSLGVNKTTVENFVDSFVHGVERTGGTMVDRRADVVGSLPGTSCVFQANKNGRKSSLVFYLVFTNQVGYVVSCYLPKEGTRSDPLVQSYFARIKVGPAVVPGNIARTGNVDINSVAYRIGEAAGAIIFFLAVGGVLIAVVRSIATSRKRAQPPPLPRM